MELLVKATNLVDCYGYESIICSCDSDCDDCDIYRCGWIDECGLGY